MSARLLGSDFRLIPGESPDVFPADGCEANADEFVGRSVDEQREAIQRLVGVLMGRDFHHQVTSAGRLVCEREERDVQDELREHWTRIAYGGGSDLTSRRIAERGLRVYGGERP